MADRKNKAGARKSTATKAPVMAKPAPAAKPPVLRVEETPAPAPVAAETAVALVDAAQAAVEIAEVAIPRAERVTEQATENVTNSIEGTITMNTETLDRVQETQQATAERFTAAFGDVNERSREAMQKSARLVEEMTDLTKGNVEAIVASSKVAARGVEQLGQEAADFSRRSFEQASATLKSFTEVRSPTDFFKLQSDYARSAFDNMVSESSKMSEAVIKLAGEVAEPITSRVAVAADRVKNVAL
jgi:phasin family protein